MLFGVSTWTDRDIILQCDPSLMSQCFPSLTICHNAARACSHVAEIHHRRRPNNPLPFAQV